MTSRIVNPPVPPLRRPTDAAQENGRFINPPRYAQFGGLHSPSKTAKRNPLAVVKPGQSVR